MKKKLMLQVRASPIWAEFPDGMPEDLMQYKVKEINFLLEKLIAKMLQGRPIKMQDEPVTCPACEGKGQI